MDTHAAGAGVNPGGKTVGRRNVGQGVRHYETLVGGGSHPILGDILDGLAGGHVAFLHLNGVLGFLHENHVVTGAPVGRVDLERLPQLGLGLIVAGHFI